MYRFLDFIESLPWVLGALVIVGAFIVFSTAGVLIVRRTVSHKTLKAHHDVAGVVFANIGVLYAVLLGFTVVNVQQRFDSIKSTTQVEASYIADLYRDAEVFPEKNKKEIQEALRAYTHHIIDDEWMLMSKGIESGNTIKALHQIWKAYYNVDPKTPKEEVWYRESISKLNNLMSSRLARLLGSTESLGAEMWTFLIIGAILLVGFIWFFGLDSITTHILMAAILAACTAFLLFLIYSLDTVFSGQLQVPADSLERVLKSFES